MQWKIENYRNLQHRSQNQEFSKVKTGVIVDISVISDTCIASLQLFNIFYCFLLKPSSQMHYDYVQTNERILKTTSPN